MGSGERVDRGLLLYTVYYLLYIALEVFIQVIGWEKIGCNRFTPFCVSIVNHIELGGILIGAINAYCCRFWMSYWLTITYCCSSAMTY